jgi:hypothetical protein
MDDPLPQLVDETPKELPVPLNPEEPSRLCPVDDTFIDDAETREFTVVPDSAEPVTLASGKFPITEAFTEPEDAEDEAVGRRFVLIVLVELVLVTS